MALPFIYVYTSETPRPRAGDFGGNEYRANIGDILAGMLYCFCNAFPALLHEWMWLVLNVSRLRKPLIKVIVCLYTFIKAFSSGCGDGSFGLRLLEV